MRTLRTCKLSEQHQYLICANTHCLIFQTEFGGGKWLTPHMRENMPRFCAAALLSPIAATSKGLTTNFSTIDCLFRHSPFCGTRRCWQGDTSDQILGCPSAGWIGGRWTVTLRALACMHKRPMLSTMYVSRYHAMASAAAWRNNLT